MTKPDPIKAALVASAIREGDADRVRTLLTQHPECRAFLDLPAALAGPEIDSWLDYAERHGHAELRSMLAREFWDPIYRGMYEDIRAGNVDALCDLLRDHPRYARDVQGGINSWFKHAAHHGHVRIAAILVDMGADVNARRFGTPLNSAVDFAGPEMVEFLLLRGADPNDSTVRPLIAAIDRDPEELALRLVQLLVEHGADLTCEYTVFGDEENVFTALEWAAKKPTVAEYLRSKD